MPWILPDPPAPAPPPVVVPAAAPQAAAVAPIAPTIGIDPYGCDLVITNSGDLASTHSGDLAAVSGPYNCAQAILQRLQTSPGEIPLHPGYGSVVAGHLIGAKQDVQAIVSQLNADLLKLLQEDLRFDSAQVIGVDAPVNGQPGSALFGVRARLAGGEQVTIDSVTDPAPVDVSLPQFVDSNVDPTLTYDPTVLAEFFAGQGELDTLTDLNAQQSLVSDLPGTSILGTLGG